MKLQRRLDAADARMVALFERRMALVRQAAAAGSKRALRKQRRRRGAEAVAKTVRHACDIEVIAYTEELIKLLLCAAQRYQKALMRRGRGT